MRAPLRTGLFLGAIGLAACAKHVPPPKAAEPPRAEEPPPPPPPPKHDREDEMTVSGVLGSLADEDIAQTFRGRWTDVTRCLRETPPKVSYLVGRVELKMRVGADGAPKTAHVQDSTLGHYGAERCLVELAQGLKFPAPKGGPEAEFSYPIEYKPPRTAAFVTDWPPERVAGDKLSADLASLQQCRASVDGKAAPPPPPPHGHGHAKKHERPRHAAAPPPAGPMRPMPPHLRLTMYVGPGGKVVAAGLAADAPVDPMMGACVVSSASTWKLDDPGGRPAKVTVEVAP